MNRTEHRLRMSFDPEYERKWKHLTLDRKFRQKVIIEKFKRFKYFLPLLTVIIFNILISPRLWWLWCINILPALILITGSISWYIDSDIKMRKQLGL